MNEIGDGGTAALLDLPADERLLILNCDDLGMYRGVNFAVIEAIAVGVATTCSLMVPCPAAPHAIELLRRHPEIPFGIHLTLISDLPGLRWSPLVPKERIRSLLDPDGELFGWEQMNDLMAHARLEELELEFRAQIEAVLAEDLEPTHIDWHCYGDGGRSDVFELGMDLALEYGLALRAFDREAQQRLKGRGLPAVEHPVLDSFDLETDGKSESFAQLLRELPAGLSQWAVHPALPNEESNAVDPEGWRVRGADYEFLTSALAREVLAEEAVTLLDYRRLQDVWRSGSEVR
jgi:chitin disaccharide deacetylase